MDTRSVPVHVAAGPTAPESPPSVLSVNGERRPVLGGVMTNLDDKQYRRDDPGRDRPGYEKAPRSRKVRQGLAHSTAGRHDERARAQVDDAVALERPKCMKSAPASWHHSCRALVNQHQKVLTIECVVRRAL